MACKTLLVFVDQTHHAAARYALTAALAQAHGAHVLGLAIAADAGRQPALAPGHLGGARDQPEAAAAVGALLLPFDHAMAAAGVSSETRLVPGPAHTALAAAARFADLVILSQHDDAEGAGKGRRFGSAGLGLVEATILRASRPVLVLPRRPARAAGSHGDPVPPYASVMLAWDGSRQAAVAMVQALPLLRAARQVIVAAFRAPQLGPVTGAGAVGPAAIEPAGLGDEMGDLLAYLQRHGVAARAEMRAEPVDMGYAIIDLATDLHCDLIVTGGFGHSRLREMWLGGVSRTLLSASTLPLLVGHA